jgi:hypothetical protein
LTAWSETLSRFFATELKSTWVLQSLVELTFNTLSQFCFPIIFLPTLGL